MAPDVPMAAAGRKTVVTVFPVFSSQQVDNKSEPSILVQRPLTSFVKALELFRKYIVKDYHKTALVRADELHKVMENQQPNICHQISKTVADAVSFNRQFLASILKTIVLCGRQNITLHGHRDNVTDLEISDVSPENHGNIGLFEFQNGDW